MEISSTFLLLLLEKSKAPGTLQFSLLVQGSLGNLFQALMLEKPLALIWTLVSRPPGFFLVYRQVNQG